ncbi:amino acid permease-associated region [Sulfobacillus acidophilus TPY]|uniref:Amino acid/polyamine/organocation transporter, APC superfamily n=1 Tax=Sulfobacillus acidophilus (strain ATCC 700253 / DSM 10332 / NAL) TaxID=679936 RepID=G8U1I6_SULAD|nr:amino acid permease-associated region [Sulfobacillus acidophilus TPY]AEW06591.1 amino acid/polyamine/organocation transporter, APC superfamily [Sulfobacillus acidophilus DSM 10332]
MREPEAPRRALSLFDLVMLGVGGLVGSGWLFSAQAAATIAGPASMISWILGGLGVSLIGITFAELSTLIPETGGIIRYPEISHGSLVSFLMGWAVIISYAGMPAIEAEAALQYAQNYWPGLYNAAAGTLTSRGLLIATVLLVGFFFLNWIGVKVFARINSQITWIKLVVPLGTALVLLAHGFHAQNWTADGGFWPHGWAGVFSAISTGGIVFTFTGYRTIFDLAGEARSPSRDLSRALIFALIFVGVVYLMLQLAFISAVPPRLLRGGWSTLHFNAPFANLAVALNLSWLSMILYADAAVSPLGTGLVYAAAFPRTVYALSKNGSVPAFFQRLNRFHVPGPATIISFLIGWTFLLPFPSWQKMVGILSSATIITYMMGPIAAAALRRSAPDWPRPFRLPGLSWIGPVGFIVGSLIFYWGGWSTNRWMALFLAIGAVIYASYSYRLAGRPRTDVTRHGLWLVVYFVGMLCLSALGSSNFGGRNWIPAPFDQIVVSLFSLIIYYWGIASAKPVAYQVDQNASDSDLATPAPIAQR